MTLTAALAGFAVVAGLLTVTPGLDTALVLRSTLAAGRRAGAATGLGIAAGLLAWGAAAAAGVSALLAASALAHDVVRLLGAAYLVWLGGRLLRTALVPRATGEAGSPPPEGAWAGARRGLLTNLLNPKIGAFYVAVLPQFLADGVPALLMGLLLALVHAGLSLLWFAVLVLAAQRARRVLARPGAQRAIDGGTGAVLVAFGLRLALSAR